MSQKQNPQNSTQDTVVGVFLDSEHAQKAIDELQSAGINAQLADKSALQAFKNAGLDQEVAQLYEGRMNEGNTIVLANAKGNGVQALDTMMNCGAEYMNLNTTEQWSNTGGTGTKGQTMPAVDYRNLDKSKRQYGRYEQTKGRANTAQEMRVQLRTETMTPVKQSVQTGEAQIHKVVHESKQEVPVTLRHEEVYVDRKAVDRPATAGEITDVKDEVISVLVYEERAELQ
ncbi:MAG: YsnF/AvaK domain-containing protein, partial [Chloroflexota bacterium]